MHPVDWFDYQDAHLWEVRPRFAGYGDPSFDTLLTALVRKADPQNLARIEAAFPEKVACIRARYAAPGGLLPGDPDDAYEHVYPGRRATS